ncbi:MAG: hypothetical protein RIS64_3158 [Bacteroidota bacterium]
MFCDEKDQEDKAFFNFYNFVTMNFLTRRMPVIAASLAIVAIAVLSCQKQDGEGLLTDVNVTVSNDLFTNVVNIQLRDAVNESLYPNDAKITVFGKDKNKIVSLTGETTLPLVDGVIQAGISPENSPTLSKPLEFGILIQADGYMDAYKTFSTNNVSDPLIEVIKLFRTQELPESVQRVSQQAGLDAQGMVGNDVTIHSPDANAVSVTLQQGTQFYDDKHNLLVGSAVKINLVRFNATKAVGVEGFPGGTRYLNATDKQGKNLGNGIFTPFGFYDISMTVNDKAVKTLSQPLNVSVVIPIEIKRVVNSLDESPNATRVGDKLAVWSLNRTTQQWVFENMSVVSVSPQGLRVRYAQSELSTWAVADPSSRELYNWLSDGAQGVAPVSAYPSSITVQSNLPVISEENRGERFYVKVSHAHNPWMSLGSLYSDLAPNSTLELSSMLSGAKHPVSLEVLRGEETDLLHRTGMLLPYNRPTLNLVDRVKRAPQANVGDLINFQFDVTFSCGAPRARTVKPNAVISYRIVGNPNAPFLTLGSLVLGKLNTSILRRGIPYQFKVTASPLSATTTDLSVSQLIIPITNTSVSYKFVNTRWGLSQIVTATYNGAPRGGREFYKLAPTFIAPGYLCGKWNRYF